MSFLRELWRKVSVQGGHARRSESLLVDGAYGGLHGSRFHLNVRLVAEVARKNLLLRLGQSDASPDPQG